jgi:hypothetical protein
MHRRSGQAQMQMRELCSDLITAKPLGNGGIAVGIQAPCRAHLLIRYCTDVTASHSVQGKIPSLSSKRLSGSLPLILQCIFSL